MNLRKKKILAAKTFGVGRERIVFLQPRLEEIKEAITKQDMRDLYQEGAIIIKEVKGRKKVQKKKIKRSVGNVRKKINTKKRDYIILTRKLRKYVAHHVAQGKISKKESIDLRKKIRNKVFRSKGHLKEILK
jgi:large subunit ribosomal protein L19e